MVVTHAGKTIIYINKSNNIFKKEYKWLIVFKKSSLNILVSV